MLLFVYGTMKRQCRNHARLYEQGAIYIGEFETADLFRLYLQGRTAIPIALRGPSGQAYPIAGELYAIEDENIGHIDACEGHPTVYERQSVTLRNLNETNDLDVQMYVYVGQPDAATLVHPTLDGALSYDSVYSRVVAT